MAIALYFCNILRSFLQYNGNGLVCNAQDKFTGFHFQLHLVIHKREILKSKPETDFPLLPRFQPDLVKTPESADKGRYPAEAVGHIQLHHLIASPVAGVFHCDTHHRIGLAGDLS